MIVEDFDNLKRITASYGYILKDKYGQPIGKSVSLDSTNYESSKYKLLDQRKKNQKTQVHQLPFTARMMRWNRTWSLFLPLKS